MNKKYIFSYLIVIIIFLTSCDIINKYDSIQEITQNPEKYSDKIVSVKGRLYTALSLASGDYDYIFDKYGNKLNVFESCGDFNAFATTKEEFVGTGVIDNGKLRCFVPVYKEGNEPQDLNEMIQKYNTNVLGVSKEKSIENTSKKPLCNQWIDSLLPEKITLMDASYNDYNTATNKFDNLVEIYWFPEQNVLNENWNDGTKISISSKTDNPEFRKGNLNGQNINYYYFLEDQKIQSGDALFEYNKKIIDNSGNILGKNYFRIKVILEKVPNSRGHFSVAFGEKYTDDFRIREYKIVDCDFIEFEIFQKENSSKDIKRPNQITENYKQNIRIIS